jgi:spermidine/putrescine transport system ATP-binding protein
MSRPCRPNQPRYQGTVASLLFDGANSAVLVREQALHRVPHRPAADRAVRRPGVGESVAFGFDPERALCFARLSAHAAEPLPCAPPQARLLPAC